MRRVISVILMLLMITSVCLTGCSESAVEETEKQDDKSEVSMVVEESTGEEEVGLMGSEARINAELPENLDFEGHTFTIINNDYSIKVWSQIDIGAEELTGEPINDAVFQRNTTVSDKYNCTVVSNKTNDLSGELAKMATAGDQTIDLATIHLRTFADLAQNKYLIDWNTVSSVNLSKPWYDQNSVKELSLNHKLYGVVTDLTLMDKQATTAIVFNKQLYDDYHFGDTYGTFYDMVKDSKWTFDVLKSMTETVSSDLDGNGIMDSDDLWGFLYQRDSLTSLLNGFMVQCATKDDEDLIQLSLMDERGSTILSEIFDYLYDNNCFNVMERFGEANWSDKMVDMFEENQSILMWIRLADVENLRTMEVDFGILPIPMYDEHQTGYKISVNPYVGTATCMPISNYNYENTGYFLEAIASESRYMLLPEYYEVTLKGKISRDEESSEMLDIIFSNRIYDLGQIFDPGGFSNTLIYMTMTYDRDAASKWAKSQRMINTTLDRLQKKFAD